MKDFEIVDLNEEKTDKFAEVMRNPTSKKILNYLKDNNSTKTEISRELKLPISTVQYSLDKLIKSGLVEEHDFHWSPKGNKVFTYKASNKIMVFTPKKSPELTIHLMKTLSIILISVALLAIFIPMFTNNQNNVDSNNVDSNILRFNSDNELIEALNSSMQGYGAYNKGLDVALAESAPLGAPGTRSATSGSSSEGSSEYSTTNIQVEGVDESDIIKNDGKYIYAVSYNTLTIIDAYPGEKAKIVFNKTFDNFNPYNIFIDKDRLMVFGQKYENRYYSEDAIYSNDVVGKNAVAGYMLPFYTSRAAILVYDTKDKSNPKLIRQTEFEGDIIGSRKIDEYVYFAINSYPHYPLMEQARDDCVKIMPVMADAKNGKNISEIAPTPISSCNEVGYIKPIQANNFITMASISIIDEDKEIKKETILGNSWNIYASKDNFYLAQSVWNYVDENGEKTIISKFSLDNGDIEFVASNKINGNILNQYSMDEFEGNFRIATTSTIYPKGYFDRMYNTPPERLGSDAVGDVEVQDEEVKDNPGLKVKEVKEPVQVNNLYVLDEDLNLIGSLENLAPKERIYSARFMGEKAFMVTFRNVDPLFVIDLSNPNKPEVLGQLKIPGFSNYLHPIDENHILGIGKDVDPTKLTEEGIPRWDSIKGVKVSIFDVSDYKNPKEIHKVVIGDTGSSSQAEYDPKSILFDYEKGLFVIPVTVIENRGDVYSYSPSFTGVYVYNIDLEDGLTLKGKIKHDFFKPKSVNKENQFAKEDQFVEPDYNYDYPIQRSLYIGENLYTLSTIGIKINDLETLDEIKTIELEQPDYGPVYYAL